MFDDPDTKKKKKKKSKKEAEDGDIYNPPNPSAFGGSPFGQDERQEFVAQPGEVPRLETVTLDPDLGTMGSIAAYFNSIRALDACVSADVGRTIAEMDDELRELRQKNSEMERLIDEEHRAHLIAMDEQRVFEGLLRDAQNHLGALHSDRRGINVAHLSVGDDRDRIAKEMEYLDKAAELEEETLVLISRCTASLERSYKDIDAHNTLLETQRRQLREDVRNEMDLMKPELQSTQEMREEEANMRKQRKEAIRARESSAIYQSANRFLATPLDQQGSPRPFVAVGRVDPVEQLSSWR